MPAAVSLRPVAAAERRRSFEDFLGICPAPRRGALRCRRKAGQIGDLHKFQGDWTPLPDLVNAVRLQQPGAEQCGWLRSPVLLAAPKYAISWPTSFEEATASKKDGEIDKLLEAKDPEEAPKAPTAAPAEPEKVVDHIHEEAQRAADAHEAFHKDLAEAQADSTVVSLDPFSAEVNWKEIAIVLGVTAVGGALGFGAAVALVPTGVAAGTGEADDPFLRDPAAEAAAAEEAERLAEVARLEEEAKEVARLEKIEALEAELNTASQQREELLARRQVLDQELQPSFAEIDAELLEIDARIAAEQNVIDPEAAARAAEAAEAAAARAEAGMQAAAGLFEQAVPSQDHLQGMFKEKMDIVQEKIPAIIKEELDTGMIELTAAMEGGGLADGADSMDDLPPLAMIIAGMAAPMQLNWIHAENTSKIGFSSFMLCMDLLAVAMDWNTPCTSWFMDYSGSFLRPWLVVDSMSLGCAVVTRVMAMSSVTATLAQMEVYSNFPLDLPSDPTMAFKMQLERHLLVGSQAMLMHSQLTNSFFFHLIDSLPIFDFVWQFLGIMLLFDTPGKFCPAGQLMTWSRVRGIVFLIGFLPNIINLVNVICKKAVASQGFCMALLRAANKADKVAFPHGPAVITLLVRAFLVRDKTDLQNMQLNVMEFETQLAEKQRDDLKEKLEAALIEATEHENKFATQEELMREKSKEEEFMTEYQAAVGKVCATFDLVTDPGAIAEQAALRAQAQMSEQMSMRSGGAAGADPDEDDGGTGSSLRQ